MYIGRSQQEEEKSIQTTKKALNEHRGIWWIKY